MILLPENMTANTPPDTVRQVKCHNLFQFDFEKTNRSLHHFTSHTKTKQRTESRPSQNTHTHRPNQNKRSKTKHTHTHTPNQNKGNKAKHRKQSKTHTHTHLRTPNQNNQTDISKYKFKSTPYNALV